MVMAIGRSARRAERLHRIEATFGKEAAPGALDLLELTELAWHDCYGEITPPEDIIDDILFCSEGDIAKLVERRTSKAHRDGKRQLISVT